MYTKGGEPEGDDRLLPVGKKFDVQSAGIEVLFTVAGYSHVTSNSCDMYSTNTSSILELSRLCCTVHHTNSCNIYSYAYAYQYEAH